MDPVAVPLTIEVIAANLDLVPELIRRSNSSTPLNSPNYSPYKPSDGVGGKSHNHNHNPKYIRLDEGKECSLLFKLF
jgi:hypothetical protein